MLPAATEIVGALGLMDQLLAVSHECDYPAEANQRPRVTHCEIYGKDMAAGAIDEWVAQQLQSHGTLYTLDEPTLRQLAPNLILTQRLCDVCAPAYGSVEALARILPSRPRVLNLEPRSLNEILDCIPAVAEAMGHLERGTPVRQQLEGRIAAVVDQVTGRPPPTAFLLEWIDPIYASGHWNPELVRLAGGVPVLSLEGEPSRRVSWDALRAANPEVLIIACCGQTVERSRKDLPLLEAQPGWSELTAVRQRRTYLVDGSAYFSRPGPRIVDSLEMLATMLHPRAFHQGPPSTANAATFRSL